MSAIISSGSGLRTTEGVSNPGPVCLALWGHFPMLLSCSRSAGQQASLPLPPGCLHWVDGSVSLLMRLVTFDWCCGPGSWTPGVMWIGD